ncbi:MAG: hypothetical protein HYV19_05075 [Gemmatimonadetes bacterium]|nr:hypothetical protein [Gemmatimonadota bacterium]
MNSAALQHRGEAAPIRLRLFGAADIVGAPGGDRLLAQPKPLLVLAWLLLARPRGFQMRDRITGLFWPDLDEGRARASLRTALSTLRDALGSDAIVRRGDTQVGVNTAIVWCDAHAFDAALAADELARALELYRGLPLEGVFPDTPAVEHWLEEERSTYRAAAADASWSLAERYERNTDLTNAARWARKAARLAGFDERRIRRVMTLLSHSGDRAAAISIFEEFARGIARDLEIEPSAETRALAARIRNDPDGNA